MGQRHPSVTQGLLYATSEDGSTTIAVGSAAWYAWLEQCNSFRFEALYVSFTVRKEKRCSGWYWYAQHRQEGKVQTAYLGKSEELTLQRLNDLAQTWQPADVSLAGLASERPRQASPTSAALCLSAEPVPSRALAPPALPTPLSSFVGRAEEVASLVALLRRDDVRLVSLVGMGGIGKTRIALRVAADLWEAFAAGVYFVPLAPVRAPQLVLPILAQALGLYRDGNRSVADLLKASLQQRQILFVLDNLEQVTPAAPLLLDLLAACPGLKLLITSREILHLSGEHHFAIGPLPFPDPTHLLPGDRLAQYPAVDLFIQRAQALVPDLPLDAASLRAIAEICARLEGLPLAIELAAARVRLLPPQALLGRLADRLQVLTQGGPDKPARQQTLRATFDWSHDLLTTDEQRVFRRLAVFAGGCELEAAEAVCATFADVTTPFLDVVASLMDKSLLVPVDRTAPTPRLRMSETVREYALERLMASGELEGTQEGHAAYYLSCAMQADPELDRSRQSLPLDRLERDYENLRATFNFLLASHDGERARRLASALRWFWYVRGRLREGLGWTARALGERAGGTALPAERNAVYIAGLFALHLDQGEQARAWLEESLALYEAVGDVPGFTKAAQTLTLFLLIQGDVAAAQAQVEKTVAMVGAQADRWAQATAHSTVGTLAMYQHHFQRARTAYERSAALYAEVNDRYLCDLTRTLAGEARAAQGDTAQGRALVAAQIQRLEAQACSWPTAYMLCAYGRIALRRGDGARGRFLLEQSLALFQRLRDPRGIAQASRVLAQAALYQQDYATAVTMALQCWQNATVVDARTTVIGCLEELADVAVRRGKAAWAAQLWGAAEQQREATTPAHHPAESADRAQLITTAREALGAMSFGEAWAGGRSLPLEQVLSVENMAGRGVPHPTLSAPRPAGLTRRELEVLLLVADGLSNPEIADRLVVSPSTIISYLNLIYKKLGVSSRTGAMRYAIDHQLR